MTENDVNPHIDNDPMEKKKRIYRSPLVYTAATGRNVLFQD